MTRIGYSILIVFILIAFVVAIFGIGLFFDTGSKLWLLLLLPWIFIFVYQIATAIHESRRGHSES